MLKITQQKITAVVLSIKYTTSKNRTAKHSGFIILINTSTDETNKLEPYINVTEVLILYSR